MDAAIPISDDQLLLHAYADGELDPPTNLKIERRLLSDSTFAAEYRAIAALREVVQSAVVLEQVSPAFLARISPALRTTAANQTTLSPWYRLAIAACLAGVLASGATFLAVRQERPDVVIATVLAAHIRGLATPQPVDVASSDRHTVKPWFDGRLAFSPIVVDLAGEGYSLVGGRMDAVAGQLAATQVYKYQQHVVTLTQARSIVGPARASTREARRDGYAVLMFNQGDLTCWVVTDLPSPQALGFSLAWQKAAAGLQ